MKQALSLLLLCACLLTMMAGCAEAPDSNIHFTIYAPATDDGLAEIDRTVTFPRTAVERNTVMGAMMCACDAMGYSYERDGKYNEILVSIAERPHGMPGEWIFEGKDKNGNPLPVTVETVLDGIVYLTVTYQTK